MDQLLRLNELSPADAEAEFLKCCGSAKWARDLAAARPFAGRAELLGKCDEISAGLKTEDWLEAFRAHPKIGENSAAKSQTTQEQGWSAQEQSGMQAASAELVSELANRNREYEARFGFIFIVCATGKSSGEMLAIINRRIHNDPQTELQVAVAEQRKITLLRLQKLLRTAQVS
jgi:2-oxo-4-hydroxy-4-carboxy-5-ureidoimidazoline decarboxylase